MPSGGTASTLTRSAGLNGDDFIPLVKALEKAIRKSLGATMFNWSCQMNHAYRESIPNPHVHWHVRPRYGRSVRVGGMVFRDAEFGHHYDPFAAVEIPEKARKLIASGIRECMGDE